MRRRGSLGAALATLFFALHLGAPAVGTAAPTPVTPPPTPATTWTVDRVRFEPLDGATTAVDGVGAYRGAVEVVLAPEGVAVINHVPVEDYVKGISEVPPSWPAEAQKAQAIAARTYALWEWSRTSEATYKALGADICATDACQVYRGLTRERQEGAQAWSAAVDATASRAIYWRNAPIKAMYSSSNGGAMVAGAEPYLRAGADADDRWSPLHQWEATYSLADVVAAAALPPATDGLYRDGDTVFAVDAADDGSQQVTPMRAADFRKRLNDGLAGPDGLPMPVPTVRFGLATAGGAVRVTGIGWGHAIGMSQWGAYGKARRGLKADDILAAYYSGLKSVPVPASRLPAVLKVAVDLGRTAAVVAPEAGAFRVVTGDGTVLAHAATGPWTATPAPGGVVVRPGAVDAGPAPAAVTAVRPVEPRAGQAVVLRLSLPRAAHVTVTATPPGGTSQPIELGIVGPGEVESTLPAAAEAGTYAAVVATDPGGGRVSATPMSLVVGAAARAPAPAVDGNGADRGAGAPFGAWALLAAMLVAAVGGKAVRIGRRELLGLH